MTSLMKTVKRIISGQMSTFLFLSAFFWQVSAHAGLSSLVDSSARAKQCLFSYFTPRQIITYERLQDLVDFNNEWYEIAVPTTRGFEYRQTRSWSEVEKSLDGLEPTDKEFISDLLWRAHSKHAEIIEHFKPLAINNRAEFRTRVKDIQSLRRKIIDRSKSYQSASKVFSVEELNDLIGIRFTLPEGSPLLNLKGDAAFFAKELNLSLDQITEVEVKGGKEDQKKGKYYQAIHLAIRIDAETRLELQLMSKAMYLWHVWDHPTVYKSKSTDVVYNEKLKKYSQTWVRIIRLAEELLSLEGRRLAEKQEELRLLLWENKIDPKISRQILPQIIDSRLGSLLGINYEDRIIMEKHKGNIQTRKDFFRVIGKLFQEINF